MAIETISNNMLETPSLKAACRLATTDTLTATTGNGTWVLTAQVHTAGSVGTSTIDGFVLADGDRILVKNETGGNDGVFVVSGDGAGVLTVLTRTDDFNTSALIVSGSMFAVQEGTANEDTLWMMATDAAITVGTTALNFIQIGNVTTAGNASTAQLAYFDTSSDVINGSSALTWNGSKLTVSNATAENFSINDTGGSTAAATDVRMTWDGGGTVRGRLRYSSGIFRWENLEGPIEISPALSSGLEVVEILKGGLVFNERADHGLTPVAAHGEIWLRNDANQSLMFTDDAGADFVIGGTGSPYITGTGTADRLAFWSGTNVLTDSANLLYDTNATTGDQLQILANTGLTSGSVLEVLGNVSTVTGPIVRIDQNHASSTARALEIKCDGTGDALYVEAFLAAGTAARFYSNIATRTQPLVEVVNDNATGTGVALSVTSDQGIGVEIVDNGTIGLDISRTITTGNAINARSTVAMTTALVDLALSSATASGSAILIAHAGTGNAIEATTTNAAGTAGRFYANVATRTQPVVEIVNDHATGAGNALYVQNDSATGLAIDVVGDVDISGDVTVGGATVYTIATLANDATPSVLGARTFLTGGTTTITDFDDGVTGQEIVIMAEHTITITDGTNIFLNGSANFAMTDSDTLTLIQKVDTFWYEIARSDSGA